MEKKGGNETEGRRQRERERAKERLEKSWVRRESKREIEMKRKRRENTCSSREYAVGIA